MTVTDVVFMISTDVVLVMGDMVTGEVDIGHDAVMLVMLSIGEEIKLGGRGVVVINS